MPVVPAWCGVVWCGVVCRYFREVATVGEHFDRDNLDPAGAQLDLMRAVINVRIMQHQIELHPSQNL